ncbi:MAG: hypothetical protein RDU01_10345 [Thermodesulfovibrionales bacterium]|nr:hypothetical protein [Thermodesulfovibrionales bacterium]
MKRVVVAVLALSLVVAVSAFAVEDTQSPKDTGLNFEQMKTNHMKKLDERTNSLQQEKTCVQAAKNQDDLMGCRSKHKADMKGRHDEMRMRDGSGGPGSAVPPQVK